MLEKTDYPFNDFDKQDKSCNLIDECMLNINLIELWTKLSKGLIFSDDLLECLRCMILNVCPSTCSK